MPGPHQGPSSLPLLRSPQTERERPRTLGSPQALGSPKPRASTTQPASRLASPGKSHVRAPGFPRSPTLEQTRRPRTHHGGRRETKYEELKGRATNITKKAQAQMVLTKSLQKVHDVSSTLVDLIEDEHVEAFGYGNTLTALHNKMAMESNGLNSNNMMAGFDGGRQVSELKQQLSIFLSDIEEKSKHIEDLQDQLRHHFASKDLAAELRNKLHQEQMQSEAYVAEIQKMRSEWKKMRMPMRYLRSGQCLDSSDEETEDVVDLRLQRQDTQDSLGERLDFDDVCGEPRLTVVMDDEEEEEEEEELPKVVQSMKGRIFGLPEHLVGTGEKDEDQVVLREGEVILVQIKLQGLVALALDRYEERDVLDISNSIIRESMVQYGGIEVKFHKGSFQMAFRIASNAILAVLKIQLNLAKQASWPELVLEKVRQNTPPEILVSYGYLRVSIAMHLGNPFVHIAPLTGKREYRGPDVNVLSKLCAVACPGEILLTKGVYEKLQNSSNESMKNSCIVRCVESVAFKETTDLMEIYQMVPDVHIERFDDFKRQRLDSLTHQLDKVQSLEMGLVGGLIQQSGDRRLCLVYCCIEGFAELMNEDEVATMSALTLYQDELAKTLKHFQGVEVFVRQEAHLTGFMDAYQAVLFALKFNQVVVALEYNQAFLSLPQAGPVYRGENLLFNGFRLKIGIHRCKVELHSDLFTNEGLYHGDQINVTACLANAARGGEVLVTHEVIKGMKTTWGLIANAGVIKKYGLVPLRLGVQELVCKPLIYQAVPMKLEQRFVLSPPVTPGLKRGSSSRLTLLQSPRYTSVEVAEVATSTDDAGIWWLPSLTNNDEPEEEAEAEVQHDSGSAEAVLAAKERLKRLLGNNKQKSSEDLVSTIEEKQLKARVKPKPPPEDTMPLADKLAVFEGNVRRILDNNKLSVSFYIEGLKLDISQAPPSAPRFELLNPFKEQRTSEWDGFVTPGIVPCLDDLIFYESRYQTPAPDPKRPQTTKTPEDQVTNFLVKGASIFGKVESPSERAQIAKEQMQEFSDLIKHLYVQLTKRQKACLFDNYMAFERLQHACEDPFVDSAEVLQMYPMAVPKVSQLKEGIYPLPLARRLEVMKGQLRHRAENIRRLEADRFTLSRMNAARQDDYRTMETACADAQGSMHRIHKVVRTYLPLQKLYAEALFDDNKSMSEDELLKKLMPLEQFCFDGKSIKRGKKEDFAAMQVMAIESEADEEKNKEMAVKLSKSIVGHINKHFNWTKAFFKRVKSLTLKAQQQ